MSGIDIICKLTRDTFMRFGIIIAALPGFALRFFYDASTDYQRSLCPAYGISNAMSSIFFRRINKIMALQKTGIYRRPGQRQVSNSLTV